MYCKCSNCDEVFEAKGFKAFEVLTGGTECPKCKGNVNIIIAKK